MLFGEFNRLSGFVCTIGVSHEMFGGNQNGRPRKEVGPGCGYGGEAASPLGLGHQVVFCFRHFVCFCYNYGQEVKCARGNKWGVCTE